MGGGGGGVIHAFLYEYSKYNATVQKFTEVHLVETSSRLSMNGVSAKVNSTGHCLVFTIATEVHLVETSSCRLSMLMNGVNVSAKVNS